MPIKEFFVQVTEVTKASLKSRYRRTWAGFLWVILNPLLLFGVQSLVFKKFLRLEIPDYFIFLLGGLLPWIFFSSTVQMGTPIFVSQSQLLRSFKINPWVILGAQVFDCFINFLASFFLIMLPYYLTSDRGMASLLFLPFAFLPLLIGTMSITVILSVLNVFYRDINFVVGFLFNLIFFLTPVFYPKEYVPENYRWLVDYNPIVFFIDPFRKVIYDSSSEGIFQVLLNSLLVSLGFLVCALIVWKRKQNDFYRRI